jgi:hypothetical protein
MGCWNGTCGLTQLAIHPGDRAVWLPLISGRYKVGTVYCHATDLYEPMGYTLRGSYDDYGCIEDIDNTPGAQITLDYFQSLITEKKLTVTNDADKKHAGMKTYGDLVRLVEREHLATYWDRKIGHMLFHEEAFDAVISDISKRTPFKEKGSRKTIEALITASVENWMKEDFSVETRKSLGKFSENFALDATRSMHGAQYYLNRLYDEKKTDLIPAIVELHLLGITMGFLRKMYQPQGGAGSQCSELFLPEILAKFVLRRKKKMEKEWRAENKEEDASWEPFKESVWYSVD